LVNARSVALIAGLSIAVAAGCDSGEKTSSSNGSAGGGGAPGATGASSSSSGGAGGASPAGTSASSSSSGGAASSSASAGSSSSSGGTTSGLHVEGNNLVDNGKTVRLLGVDHSGSEYSCIQGKGFFDGPVDQTSVTQMLAWHINAVRLPLNEDCWLAINGAPAQYSGSGYQTAISQYVSLLRQNGIYVILDLHWNAGGTGQATGQQEMADSDHALDFWKGVAGAFQSDLGVVFDLYNEPHDISWPCWQNGGCMDGTWPVAGMNQLIAAVRGTGATNVVMAGGLSYSGDLSQWLAYKPTDSTGNLAASFHSYNFSNCHDSTCWSSQLQPVAAQVPIITGELGENDCQAANMFEVAGADYINGFMTWADSNGVSYLGWAWNADFDHCTGPSLNSTGDWTGATPTSPFGTDFQTHLMAVGP
jgi:endoglucanase